MKPSFSDAPHWANWLAMNQNGSWYWFEYEPTQSVLGWWYASAGVFCEAEFQDWKEIKEHR